MNKRRLFLGLLLAHWLLSLCGFLGGLFHQNSPAEESPTVLLERIPQELALLLAAVWLIGGILILLGFSKHFSWALPSLVAYHVVFGIAIPVYDPFVETTPNLFIVIESLSYLFLGMAVSLYLFNRETVRPGSAPA